MALKTILLSLGIALLAAGCVAFPEDGPYNHGGYQPQGGYGHYDDRYDRQYNQREDRARWERERAYRLQQARIEQQRRQEQLKREQWQREQAQREQIQKQQWEKRQRIEAKKYQNQPTDKKWDKRDHRNDEDYDHKRDSRRQWDHQD